MVMPRNKLILFVLIGLWFIMSCGTIEIGIERTPTLDYHGISTLSNLILRGTQLALTATSSYVITPSLQPKGLINGHICYPGERIPAMLLYFREISTNQLTVLDIMENQNQYSISLTPGKYYIFAWVISYQVGGLYSYAVPCGLGENCTNHSPLVVNLGNDETAADIDVCDWALPEDKLPIPLGFSFPKP